MNRKHEWEIIPIAPDTSEDIRQKIMPAIEEGLRESGHETLLTNREIQVEQKENFPDMDHQTVMILVQFATNIGLQVFKTYVLPKLRKLAEVREREAGDNVPPDTGKA